MKERGEWVDEISTGRDNYYRSAGYNGAAACDCGPFACIGGCLVRGQDHFQAGDENILVRYSANPLPGGIFGYGCIPDTWRINCSYWKMQNSGTQMRMWSTIFEHVSRVYQLAMRLAEQEGADPEIVAAAALLHDSKGSAPDSSGKRQGHHLTSAVFAGEVLRNAGWPGERIEAVQHCIRAHRFRSTEAPETIEAQVVFDADKLDAIGAIGTARAIAYSVLAGQPFYAPPSEQFLESGQKLEGEPHSAYHEYRFKLSKIIGKLYTGSAQALGKQRQEIMQAFFESLALEHQNKMIGK